MGTKKNSPVDIIKEGPQSYRDLQSANAQNYANIQTPGAPYKVAPITSFIYEGSEKSPLMQLSEALGRSDYWGSSMFDNPTASPDEWSAEEFAKTRSLNLPLLAKLGSSLINGTTLAATTFASGFANLLYGVPMAIAKGDFSQVWNNELNKGLSEINSLMELIAPYYENQDKEWYLKIVGGDFLDFWANGLLKNLGFTVGAVYSGNVFNLALKGLGLLSKTSVLGSRITGSLFSAATEGAFEANTNAKEMVDKGTQIINLAFNDRYNSILSNPSLSPELKEYEISSLRLRTSEELDNLLELAKYMGNMDMLLNIPVLAYTDFKTFGRVLSRGFSDARNISVDRTKGNFFKRMWGKAEEELSATENITAENTIKEAGRYAWKDITKKEALGKGLMSGLREGNEEMLQGLAAEFSTNLYSYDDPDMYYKAITDPSSEKRTSDIMTSLVRAFSDTYGNIDKYQEFAIGALTGLLGVPTFGKTMNLGADTYLGRGKSVGLTGGIFGELALASEDNRRGRENVSWMNKLQDKRDTEKKNLMLAEAFNNAMDGYAAADDKFNYLNQEDNEIFRMIGAYLSAGRKDDLMRIIDADFENATDEELEKIAMLASPTYLKNEDGTINTTGWRNKATGEFIKPGSEEMLDMRQLIIDKRDKIKNQIKDYEKSLAMVRGISGHDVNLSEDEIHELAWLKWKTLRFPERVKEIQKDFAPLFSRLELALTLFLEKLREILNMLEESTEGLSAAATTIAEQRNRDLRQAKKNAQAALNVASLYKQIINSLQNSDSAMPFLGPLLSIDKEFLQELYNNAGTVASDMLHSSMTQLEFLDVTRAIQDLGRLYQANSDFNRRLEEYIKNPNKQKLNRLRIDQQNEKKQNAINKQTLRKKSKGITRQLIINGEVSTDEVDKAILTLESSGISEDKLEAEKLKEERKIADAATAAEIAIQKAREELAYDDLDLQAAESAILAGISLVKNSSEISGLSSLFMQDSNGNPLTDDLISIVEELIDKALTASKTKEELDATDPRGTLAAEKAIEEEERKANLATTGHDAVDKLLPENDGVSSKGRPNRGKGRSSKKGNNKRQKPKNKTVKEATRTALQKKDKQKEEDTKQNIINKAIAFVMAANRPALMSADDSKKQKIGSDTASLMELAYHHIKDDEITDLKSVLDVLKESEEYKELIEILGEEPNIIGAIKSIYESLNTLYTEATLLEKDQDELDKIEDEVGPATIGTPEKISDDSFNGKSRLKQVISSLVPSISLVTRTPSGRVEATPHYKHEKDKTKRKIEQAIFEYLESHHAFENGANVEVGDTIYFTTDPSLNEKAGTFVVLMSTDPEGKNIVGSLATREYSSHQNNPLLKALYNRVEREFNIWSKGDKTTPFRSKETSTVNLTLLGHILFTDSATAKDDNTLNDIFSVAGKKIPFYIGVAVGPDTITATNLGGPEAVEPFNILPPKKEFKVGTPFVLIPSGKGTNLYVAVPFMTPKFRELNDSASFIKFAHDTILLAITQEQLINGDGTILWRALLSLFSESWNVSITDRNGTKFINIKKYKDPANKDNGLDVIFSTELNSGSANKLIDFARRSNTLIRINRRLMNTTLSDGTAYNSIIGEFAHTNLPTNTTTTVNDWFAVNPLDYDGKEVSVDPIVYPKPESRPAESKGYTLVTYKGTKYNVTSTNTIVKEDSTPIEELDLTDRQIIQAKAELQRNENRIALGNSAFWFRLNNGNLFYNKDGEEQLLTKQEDIDKKLAELNKKPEDSNTPSTPNADLQDAAKALEEGLTGDALYDSGEEDWEESSTLPLEKLEEKKPEKPKSNAPSAFKTQSLKDLFESLNKENQLKILELSATLLTAVARDLADLLKDYKKISKIPKDEISNVIDDAAKYRKTNEEYEQADIEKETAWLKKALPQLSDDEHLRIARGLIKISNSSNPKYAWGKTQKGIMTISDIASRGTVYHEAFHAVIDTLLNDSEIEKLFKEGSLKYGIPLDTDDNYLNVEENLAEDFRKYVLKELIPGIGFIVRTFRTLKHIILSWRRNEPFINNMFYRINRGKLSNRSIQSKDRGTRASDTYTDEMKSIMKQTKRNGTFMKAPNGKPTNLSERQWLQVRTKAFKRWFGDWEVEPNIVEQLKLVFKRNSELAKVANIIDYARYLKSIFPSSKVLDIYWHGSNEDFSRGFASAQRSKGSGALETRERSDFYLAKQAWSVLLYVNGINRNSIDKNGFAHWNKLWWELREIMSNGRRDNNNWKDLIIGSSTVRQSIPNKKGIFNRDSGGSNGKWLSERKADYGYENKSDKEFFEDILGIKWGVDTFNSWIARNAEVFKSLEGTAKGIYPAILDVRTPIIETRLNTYYEELRGLFSLADINGNDTILGANTDNEFGSDVAVILRNPKDRVHFLGTKDDIEAFIKWKELDLSVSKVVDENGEPLVVYHGSPEYGFNTFEMSLGRVYFSNDDYVASTYAFNDPSLVYEVFLNIRNPKEVDFEKRTWNKHPVYKSSDSLIRSLDSNNDGAILTNIYDTAYANLDAALGIGLGTDYIITDPNQVKSATDNVGTFSKTNNDIRYRLILEYHDLRLSYENLDKAIKLYLLNRGVSQENFDALTIAERENLLRCM